MSSVKKVVIIQAVCKQYRVPFFEGLCHALGQEGIELKIAYSAPSKTESLKLDNVDLGSKYGVKVPAYWFFNDKLLFQPLLGEILNSDLVIVELANKHIINYFLLIASSLKLKKIAFWGHGRNRQAKEKGISEWFKKKTLSRVDWWFAYTQGTAEYLIAQDVPAREVTIVQNSVSTQEFQGSLLRIDEKTLQAERQRLGIKDDAPIGLFCGGLYSEKRLEFLIEAVKLVKKKILDFELIIIGSGPDSPFVKEVSEQLSWVHYLGSKFGIEKAIYFRIAQVFLMPGLVGLAILDAFAASLPIVTTDISTHSPEIEYLEDGVNGFITENNSGAYAAVVTNLLIDDELLSRLQQGATCSSGRYTLQAMIENFKTGIVKFFTNFPA